MRRDNIRNKKVEGDKSTSNSGANRSRGGKPTRNEKANDPEMWNGGNLALYAGRIPFTSPMGYRNPLGSPTHAGHMVLNGVSAGKNVFPGIMTMLFAPTFGISKSADDPVNLAKEKFVAAIKAKVNGQRPYDGTDLMMYYTHLDSEYMWQAELIRLYGVLMNYKNTHWNFYTPKMLVTALGFDFDDIMLHIDELRFHINYLAEQLNVWHIPKKIGYFARHMMLAGNIFWDADTVKSQMFIYRPGFYGKYVDETDGPGYLQAVPRPHYMGMTYADIVAFSAQLISNVSIEQSFGQMNGDTLYTYGAENCYRAPSITDDYRYEPIYSKEILGQIMNNTLFHDVTYKDQKMLYQNTTDNLLHSGITIRVAVPLYDSNRIMRSFEDQPDPKEVMINSRGMVMGDIDLSSEPSQIGSSGYYLYDFVPSSLGTEIVFGADVYCMNPDAAGGYERRPVDLYGVSVNNIGDYGSNHNAACAWSAFFTGAPLIVSCTRSTEFDATNHLYNWSGYTHTNIDSYAVITKPQLDMLHTAALMSVFSLND